MPDVPTTYRFSIGPWNISEGRDPYGPETRPAKDFAWKLEQFKKGGFDAVMFHDDDVVPDIDSKSRQQVLKEAKQVRKMVEDAGMFVELVAPRLWFSSATITAPTPVMTPTHGNMQSIDHSRPSIWPRPSAPISWCCGWPAKERMCASRRVVDVHSVYWLTPLTKC